MSYPKKNINRNKASNKTQPPLTSKEASLSYLLPMIFVIAILPLIVKMHLFSTNLSRFDWFVDNDKSYDFFLYYKQLFLIITAVVMFGIIVYNAYFNKISISFSKIFIPLIIYAILALLSSILSKYRSFCFTGIKDQFESIFALLSYCLLTYYAYTFIKTERDIRILIYSLLISTILLGLIGLSQFLNHDFYSTQIGLSLITNSTYANHKDFFDFSAGDKRVYLSFYNPNYVGMYVSLILPILFFMILFTKKIWLRLLFIVSFLGLIISLYGSFSTSGIVAVIIALILSAILLWRYLAKYFYISIPIVILAVVALFIVNAKSNNYLSYLLSKVTMIQKSTPILSEIQTNDENVTIKYNGNTLKVTFSSDANGVCNFTFLDQNNTSVPFAVDSINGTVSITDSRYPDFVFTPTMYGEIFGFTIPFNGASWFFTNQTEDHSYYYINPYGKLTKIVSAPSAVFTGYERYASGRGYIWSRTIPLLKNKVFLGSGADTFTFAFPQKDYVNLSNYGFLGQILTKPHSLYLQIAVQTGIISLIAFIIFYIMYFISSFKLYIRGKFDSIHKIVGVGIFTGSFGYMISAISNDSNITVAPVFWLLIGVGLAVNKIVKQEQLNIN